MFSYKEMYDEAYDPIYRDSFEAGMHGALKKIPRKRTTYDDALLEEINTEKQRKIDEQKEREARLNVAPVPLPDEKDLDLIIKEVHTGISKGETKGVDDFNYYYISGYKNIEFFTLGGFADGYGSWLEPLKNWVREAYRIRCANSKEEDIVRSQVLLGVESFFQSICYGYNKKHVYSQAKLKEGGFRILY